MAGEVAEANGTINGAYEVRELESLLAGQGRDFLFRSNGDQVHVSSLKGKVVGLYFSASWCGPCRRFTPKLIEVYEDLSSRGSDFEVVFVSADEDEQSFRDYFSKMPWLAIPFSDTQTRDHLDEFFKVNGIPHLIILDGNGKVLTEDGAQTISTYGSEAYPFTRDRMKKMEEDEESAKLNQTIQSVLATASRDFLISNDGKKVPVSELVGKIVALYFSISNFRSCLEFTPVLVEMYRKLKERAESFEVVLVSLDDERSSFEQAFSGLPWLAIPYKDKSIQRLVRYFDLETIPTLVVVGADGKTLHTNAAELVEQHGVEAYPFSLDKLEELAEKEKATLEAQTLDSLLVLGNLDYVIGKNGIKVPVLDLVGKNILLYFSAHWCPPCRAFLPKLIDAYHKIKAKDDSLEVIFISSDSDQKSFDDFFSTMPWFALPYDDPRKKSLSRTFKINGIPSLIALGPSGKTVTKEARELIQSHGADAYPFTDERLKELEAEIDDMAKTWPEKLNSTLHEHPLSLIRRKNYLCDKCVEEGSHWSFYCGECDFDLHPKCAFEEAKEETDVDKPDDKQKEHADTGKGGYVCEGEVCYKA